MPKVIGSFAGGEDRCKAADNATRSGSGISFLSLRRRWSATLSCHRARSHRPVQPHYLGVGVSLIDENQPSRPDQTCPVLASSVAAREPRPRVRLSRTVELGRHVGAHPSCALGCGARAGKAREASPTVAIIDSQTAKGAQRGVLVRSFGLRGGQEAQGSQMRAPEKFRVKPHNFRNGGA